MQNCIIEKCILLVLVKIVVEYNKVFIVLFEVFEVFNKFLKLDEDNVIGDV